MKYFMMAALLIACGDKDTGEEEAVEEQDSAVEAEQNKKTPQGGMGLLMSHFFLEDSSEYY